MISNVDAKPHSDPAEIRGLLARQVCGVVEWHDSMEFLLSTGVGSLWEVGPGRVLSGSPQENQQENAVQRRD